MDKLQTKTIDASQPLKSRQEAFCQIFAGGLVTATEAYRQAGYSEIGADGHSARLVGKGSIVKRLAHLKAQTAEKHEVTREILAEEYSCAYSIAHGQSSATGMVAATGGRARLYGLDKQVVEHKDAHKALSMTERQEAKEYAAFKLWQAIRRDEEHNGKDTSRESKEVS